MVSSQLPIRSLVAGRASGTVLTLEEPLSFWGGLDPETGAISDPRHPQAQSSTNGRILVMAYGRGSSSASSVLAECIRAGVGPAAIVLAQPDAVVTLGALAAAELYPDRICPVVVTTSAQDFLAVSAVGLTTLPGRAVVSPTTIEIDSIPES